MSDLQILHGASAAEVEEIRSDASVAGATSQSLSDVDEAMLDSDALAQKAPPFRRCDQFSQPMLKAFVIG